MGDESEWPFGKEWEKIKDAADMEKGMKARLPKKREKTGGNSDP